LGPLSGEDSGWERAGGTEHRLAETRGQTPPPLPGKALAVFDPALDLIVDLAPSPDAYTQERAVAAGCWRGPGGECGSRTAILHRGLLWTCSRRSGGRVREHAQMPFTPLESLRWSGNRERAGVRTAGVDRRPDGSGPGSAADSPGTAPPTRDGDDTLSRLTTVPAAAVDACTLARLYASAGPWRSFLHLTVQLRGELNPWPIPRRPGSVGDGGGAYNGLAVVKATLRQVHGAAAIDAGVSGYYLVHEMAWVTERLETLVEPRDWAVFQTLPLATMAPG